MADRKVVIVGASDKPERYSYRALKLLAEKGFQPLPLNPRLQSIGGIECFPDMESITGPIDTVTLYLRPERLKLLIPSILSKKPGRVIFNPGTEAPEIEEEFRKHGIPIVKACTLVLLRTNQF